MNSDSDSDSERLAPRQQRTVFDHIRAMKPAAIDRLYGKGTILDPAVNGMQGGFAGSRSASRSAKDGASSKKLLIGYKKVEPGGEAVPWTCRAVLQSLPPLAQHYALRLLFVDEPPASSPTSGTSAGAGSAGKGGDPSAVPPVAHLSLPGAVLLREVRCWTHAEQEAAHEEALDALAALNIIEFRVVEASATGLTAADAVGGEMAGTSSSSSSSSRSSSSGSNSKRRRRESNAVAMTVFFQRGLRIALTSAQSVPWRDLTKPLKPDKHATTAAQVDQNMHDQWDKVLNYLVEPRCSKKVGAAVKAFLIKARLIVKVRQVDLLDDEEDEDDEAAAEEEERAQEQRRLQLQRQQQRQRRASSSSSSSSAAASAEFDWTQDDDDDDDNEGNGGVGGGRKGGKGRPKVKQEEEEEIEEEQEVDPGPRYAIGPRGYEFLLQNIHVQMWRFAEELISNQHHSSSSSSSPSSPSTSNKQFNIEVVLRFLFQLGYCKVGQDYPVAALTSEEQRLLEHFCAFGFCLRRTRQSDGKGASRFYPSSVACSLVDGFKQQQKQQQQQLQQEQQQQQQQGISSSSGAAAVAVGSISATPQTRQPVAAASSSSSSSSSSLSSSSSPSSSGLISRIANLSHFETIVQTNFQVIAYTTNELHLRMLGLFCQLKAILPNAVVAVITRKSVMDALQDGITARQIISFLETNAHPRAIARQQTQTQQQQANSSSTSSSTQKANAAAPTGAGGVDEGKEGPNSSIVPETVKAQLILWERERNRITAHRAVLYSFDMATCPLPKFQRMCGALSEEGLLLWSLPHKRRLAVKASPPGDSERKLDEAAVGIMESA